MPDENPIRRARRRPDNPIAAARRSARREEFLARPREERVGVSSLDPSQGPAYMRAPGENPAGLAMMPGRGASFGTTDEITAGLVSAANQAGLLENPVTYDQALAMLRAQEASTARDNPVAAPALEALGGISAAVGLPATGVARTAAWPVKAAAGAGTGALYGGAYGFGTGQGGAASRLESSLLPAGIGLAAGAVSPLVGALAKKGSRAVNAAITRSRSGVSGQGTQEKVAAALAADEAVNPAARNVSPTGMVADAGPATRSLLTATLSRTAAPAARRAIEQRASQATRNVSGALDDAFGPKMNANAVKRGVVEGTAQVRDDVYKAAYNAKVDYGGEAWGRLQSRLVSRLQESDIREANRLLRRDGLNTISFDKLTAGAHKLSVREVDYITRGLRQVAASSEGTGALGGKTPYGSASERLATETRRQLREIVPEYGKALDTAADSIAATQAVDFGRDALRVSSSVDDVLDTFSTMSTAEKSFAEKGMRSYIDELVGKVRRAATDRNVDIDETLKAIRELSSDGARVKVEALLGPEGATKLTSVLDDSISILELRGAVVAANRSLGRGLAGRAAAEVSGSGPSTVVRGGPIGQTSAHFWSSIGTRPEDVTRKMTKTALEDIADALTRSGPAGQRAAAGLRGAERAEGDALLAAALAEITAMRSAPAITAQYRGMRGRQ